MKIALQLWTVRELTERDMLGTLHALGRSGYRAVELAGLGNAAAADIRRTLDASGMHAVSAHVGLDHLTDHLDQVIDEMQTLGCTQVVLPWIPVADRAPLDRVHRLAERCNGIAAALAAAGLSFAYHNEDYDFLPLGASTLWHAMVASTDPAHVELQLDLFTAYLMNVDPLELMREHGARMTSLHLCDARDRAYVAIGSGTLDWPMILRAARATAARWLIVEHDAPQHPLHDAETSLRRLEYFLNEGRG